MMIFEAQEYRAVVIVWLSHLQAAVACIYLSSLKAKGFDTFFLLRWERNESADKEAFVFLRIFPSK